MGLLRKFFFKVLYNFGFGGFLLKRNRKKFRVPVLVFHKIIPEYDPVWPGIHPRLFEEMILLLKKHYRILPLNDLLNANKMNLQDVCFITFDDGYKDYLDFAYPIMKKHGVHSSLFVLPYDMSNEGHIWTSTIIFFVKHYSFDEIREFLISQNQKIELKEGSSEFALNLAITRHFCDLQQTERQSFLKTLRLKFSADKRVINNELLTFEELKELDPEYSAIESHSLTHPSFKNETVENFIDHELKYSKKLIEVKLSRTVTSFAFPFGKFNRISEMIVKKYYKMCFTRIDDFINLKQLESEPDYLYDLPRFNVHQDSAEEMFFVINGFHAGLKRRFSNK